MSIRSITDGNTREYSQFKHTLLIEREEAGGAIYLSQGVIYEGEIADHLGIRIPYDAARSLAKVLKNSSKNFYSSCRHECSNFRLYIPELFAKEMSKQITFSIEDMHNHLVSGRFTASQEVWQAIGKDLADWLSEDVAWEDLPEREGEVPFVIGPASTSRSSNSLKSILFAPRPLVTHK